MYVSKKGLIRIIKMLDSDQFEVTEEILPPVKSFDIPDIRIGIDGRPSVFSRGKGYEKESRLFNIKATMN